MEVGGGGSFYAWFHCQAPLNIRGEPTANGQLIEWLVVRRTSADVWRVERYVERSVESVTALFTVDTGRVVLTVDADSAAGHDAVYVHARLVGGNLLIVDALVRVTVTLASCQTHTDKIIATLVRQ